jgi:hypothetical protein
MMSDARQVCRLRLLFVAVMRFVATGLAIFMLAWLVGYGIAFEFGARYAEIGGIIENWSSMAIILFYLIAAVVLWLSSPFISRISIRCPEAKCPKCRFSLEYFRADRCPECGLFLGEDFHAPPPAGESKSSDS